MEIKFSHVCGTVCSIYCMVPVVPAGSIGTMAEAGNGHDPLHTTTAGFAHAYQAVSPAH